MQLRWSFFSWFSSQQLHTQHSPQGQWTHPCCRTIPKGRQRLLLSFVVFSSLEMLHLHLKKKTFFNNFNNDTKIHMEMGKMVCFDRNWQESKQSNFELSEVQFHWIAKYLCKIEIVENSIFVFQVLPPQDSKLLG